uniref:Ortho-benzoquinone reductase n=1 Tax=Alcaligenes sp. NyZ215 TaxID=441452 RepID=A7KS55_9BURK|nr:ortho-benzoquinone reductase [Alcaligenes sp. NyZ215]
MFLYIKSVRNGMDQSWMDVRVASLNVEADDIVSLELMPSDGEPLPSFSAGSHIDLKLPNGLIRQYSLCNDSSEKNRYQIAVLLDPATRGGSASVHRDIKVNQIINISKPRQNFPLIDARYSILIAGGIGVTPLLSMAKRLDRTDASFEMHYCTRSSSRTAFTQHIRTASFADRVHFHYDDGDQTQKFDIDSVFVERNSDAHIYVCGPSGFMDFVINSAKDRGWPNEQIHFEYFSREVIANDHTQFKVEVASSGQRFDIPADRSIVSVLEENGIEIPVSCEQGICGTCVTRVLEGVPDHRDTFFSDAEKEKNDQITPCCSRARTPLLILDL